MNSPVLKRVLVTFLTALFLILFFHQRVLAVELAELPSMPSADKNTTQPDCTNVKTLIADFSSQLAKTNENLLQYLSITRLQYRAWHASLSPYEGQLPRWAKGQFSPLKNSAARLEEAKGLLYDFLDETEFYLGDIRSVMENAECWPESEAKTAALAQLSTFLLNNGEHLATTADFVLGMRSRLQGMANRWAATEKDADGESPQDPLPKGYFAQLQTDAEIFSNTAQHVRNNANYVQTQLEKFKALLDPLFLPLAPRP